jgi:hypothetical protein
MKCPNCETENPPSRTFCLRCGKQLEPTVSLPVPDLSAIVDGLRGELAAVTSALESLREEHAGVVRERQHLSEEARHLVNERDGLRQREGQLAAAAEEARQEAESLRGRVGDLEKHARDLERSLERASQGVSGPRRRPGWLIAGGIAAILVAGGVAGALVAGGAVGHLVGLRSSRSADESRIAALQAERERLESELAAAQQREAIPDTAEAAAPSEPPAAAAALAKREQTIRAREAELERLDRQLSERQATIDGERSLLAKDRQAFEAARRAAPADAPPVPSPAPGPGPATDEKVFLSWRASLQGTTPTSIVIQAGKANFGNVTTTVTPNRSCRPAMRSSGVEKVIVQIEPGPKNGWARAYFQVYPLAGAGRKPGDPGEPAVVEFFCRS